MVPGWIAVAGWLAAWTVLGLLSIRLLAKCRPGDRLPLLLRGDGQAGWMVSPLVAVGFAPLFSVVAGGITIAAAYVLGRGQAPIMNVLLAGIFVFTHAVYVHQAGRWLDRQRNG